VVVARNRGRPVNRYKEHIRELAILGPVSEQLRPVRDRIDWTLGCRHERDSRYLGQRGRSEVTGRSPLRG
jgi:hypothetical protein